MYLILKSKKIYLGFFILILINSVGCNKRELIQNKQPHIHIGSKILTNEIYYFPANKPNSSRVYIQKLKQFDLIFVGHTIHDKKKRKLNTIENLAALIPGTYTHTLAYLGKDSEGYAYGIEMNADHNQSFHINQNGVRLGGGIHLFCLGSDYGYKHCPKSTYSYGLKSYDFMWAKRLKYNIEPYRKKILMRIAKDYKEKHPFQIPFDLSTKTEKTKIIKILDDGHKNGASCAEYFVTLFEDIMEVCLDDVRIDAKELQKYYTSNPIGKKALIPIRYGIFFQEDIYLNKLFKELGYHIENNPPRQTKCAEKTGIVTPDLLYNSKYLHHIPSQNK